MQLETRYPVNASPVDQVKALGMAYEGADPGQILRGVLAEFPGDVALVSSFGAEAAVLLHMASKVDPDIPVLLVDTLMLFKETLDYQVELADTFGLRNVQRIQPDALDLAVADPADDLHSRDQNACCNMRKVAPLDRALKHWPVVVSGRKRFQASTRVDLEVFENVDDKLRVSPLAHWTSEDLRRYADQHELPRHPLVAKGYPSIGCAPCTSRVEEGEDSRAGRWRGSDKVECGIHFGADGRILRKAS